MASNWSYSDAEITSLLETLNGIDIIKKSQHIAGISFSITCDKSLTFCKILTS